MVVYQVAILKVLNTVTANSVRAAEQMVETGIIQLLQPLALTGGEVGRAATKLWDRLVDYAGPQVCHNTLCGENYYSGALKEEITTLAFF